MTPAAASLGYRLLDYYALATCVLLAVVPILLGLRQPARRIAVGRAALGGLLALLALGFVPHWPRVGLAGLLTSTPERTTIPPAASVAPARSAGPLPGASESSRPALDAGRPDGIAPPVPTAPERPVAGVVRTATTAPDRALIAVRAFVVGSGAMLAWLAVGSWRVSVLRRRSRRATPAAEAVLSWLVGDAPTPALLVHDALGQPVAIGVLRPTIILPSRFLDEPTARLEAALAHEWGHIRNGDLRLIAASRLLLPILFAHPIYWWLRRLIRDDQEALADAAAASAVGGRLGYAEILFAWSRTSPDRSWLAAGGSVALFERPSQVKRRIAMLLDGEFRVEPTCPARWRIAARALTATAVVAASFLTLRPAAGGADGPGIPRPVVQAQEPTPPAPSKTEPDAIEARLLDPDGKPVAGARVYLDESMTFAGPKRPGPTLTLVGTTGPDGLFRYPRGRSDAYVRSRVIVAAEGYGPTFVDRTPAGEDEVVPLVRDDVPIRGRVIDARGRPVAGAAVTVASISWNPSGDVDRLIDGFRPRTSEPRPGETERSWSIDVPFLPSAVADQDGRFTIRGVGRGRIASLRVAGTGIETAQIRVATREMPAVEVLFVPGRKDGPKETYYGATFEYVAPPGREVVGTVTDLETGRPVAGATVGSSRWSTSVDPDFQTTTDPQGRYRLVGLPAKPGRFNGDIEEIIAGGGATPPYLSATKPIGRFEAGKPTIVDLALRRGVRVKGRVVDKQTGQGVRSIAVYFVLAGNPYCTPNPRAMSSSLPIGPWTDDDGNFELVASPGPGAIAVRARGKSFLYDDEGMPYRRGTGVETIPGLKWQSVESGLVDTLTDIFKPYEYHGVAGVDPKPGDAEITCEILLDRGRSVPGRVVGPDGSPLAGAVVLGDEDYIFDRGPEPQPSADFVVATLVPNAPRTVTAYHAEKNLAGSLVVGPDEVGPVVLKLEPQGEVTGRLIDAAGLPVAGWQIMHGNPQSSKPSDAGGGAVVATTAGDGRFRIPRIVPGRSYTFTVWSLRPNPQHPRNVTLVEGLIVPSGETKDLGDVSRDAGD
ncbi:M56 family metallopeptidase [Paludisphaera mucosa]|uniref:M56 family metallopeptidase n=1 Tax=Paludisphaera mucosa TaxID=3030827 RepID=A0ABT6FAZ0_9BACT|nr:M56 family metallopeptidase [Paludisphaera mucosa]MDG3004737.1 M56 family metallopeptidase [Paludisphaera mucosa]